MRTNIVKVTLGRLTTVSKNQLWKEDYGQKIQFLGVDLPYSYEVDFADAPNGQAITMLGDETGVLVPDELLQKEGKIYAYLYLHTGMDDGETQYEVILPVEQRAERTDIEPTPVEHSIIEQAIVTLNNAVEKTAADVESSDANALRSEGYAVGTQDGEPVEQGSPYYRHNSLWLSQQAGQSANKAEAQASLSEAWAVGEISGHPVSSDYPQYHNNSKYYSEQAKQSAEDAERSAQAVLGLTADASVDANVGTPSVEVEVTTESDHKNMSFAFHNLKGVQGDPGNTGVGISSVILNADYTLTINLTNGASYTTSSIRGEVGATPNLTIGTVATLPEGSQATATITGTDEDPVLNLGIPVGDTGDTGISPIITVTQISGGHSVAVTDAQGTQTFDVMDGEVTSEALEERLIDKADVITSSASGEIVTIADGGKDMPVVDLKLSLLPVQSGSGDPSPDNVRPISGWTGVEVTQKSKNLIGGIDVANRIKDKFGANATIDTTAKTVSFAPTVAQGYHSVLYNLDHESEQIPFPYYYPFKENTQYTFIFKATTTSSANNLHLGVSYTDGTNNGGFKKTQADSNGYIVWTSASNKTVLSFYAGIYVNSTPTVLYYDTVGVFEGVVTLNDFAPYLGSEHYPISWQSSAGTVYNAIIRPLIGDLEVTWKLVDLGALSWSKSGVRFDSGYIDLYRFTSGYRTVICDTYKTIANVSGSLFNTNVSDYTMCFNASAGRPYLMVKDSRFTTASDLKAYLSGHYAICRLKFENILHYQLDPIQISTLLGVNNIWSNSNGQIDLEYRADTKLYIEQLTKPTEDDMVANKNITLGEFFMIGNHLYQASSAISTGETIAVGTNCTELSLADGLNLLKNS